MQNKTFTLLELSSRFQLRLKGENIKIKGVASLKDATSNHLCCIRNEKFLKDAIISNACAFVVNDKLSKEIKKPVLIGDDPYYSFIKIKELFLEPIRIHKNNMFFVHETAILEENVEIGSFSHIGANVKIGKNSKIHPGVKILDNVKVGENTEIFPNTVIFNEIIIGNNCVIGANTVIGGDGFGFHFANGVHNKVPQTGNVDIGDFVEIGSNVSIDRATFGSTVIGEGCKIDNQIQIGHNVKLGKHVIIAAQTGISGSVEIGDYSVFAGRSGSVGHVKIGKGVTVGGNSVVTKSIEDGKFVVGYPAIDNKEWKTQKIYLSNLPELRKKIKKQENIIKEIQEKLGD